MMATLLVTTILMPLFGAAIVWAFASLGRSHVRVLALVQSLITLVLASVLILNYKPDVLAEFQWLRYDARPDVRTSLEFDGVSLCLFDLSALLTVTSVLFRWEATKDQPALFYTMLLLLEFGCLGVFAARDIVLFYVFSEFTLIPLLFLIGICGVRTGATPPLSFSCLRWRAACLRF